MELLIDHIENHTGPGVMRTMMMIRLQTRMLTMVLMTLIGEVVS
jgi:hypothetical protein